MLLFKFFLPQIFILLASVALNRADYKIDDANTTALTYSLNPSKTVKWAPFGFHDTLQLDAPPNNIGITNFTVNATSCYNGTFTYGYCSTSDNCHVQFTFIGSGATIYVFQAGQEGVTVSVTVDGGSPETASLAPVGISYKSDVLLFSKQSLTSGSHNMTMTVLDYSADPSGLMLDYIAINETLVTAPTTTTSASTPSASMATSHSKSHVDAVVGGAVGGLLVIVATILVLLYFRRRKLNTANKTETDLDDMFQPFISDTVPVAHPMSPFVMASYSDSNQWSRAANATNTSSDAAPIFSRPQSNPFEYSSPVPVRGSRSSLLRSNAIDIPAQLTDEQADFLNNLHKYNVPASTIAHVVARMLDELGVATGDISPVNDDTERQHPPNYEFHNKNAGLRDP